MNFLDVTLNLSTGKYHPYSKPNNTPLYVHSKSNHPPSVLRNIPLSINKRLTEISSDQDSFEQASPPYQQALDKSGYNHKLQFKHPLNLTTNNKTRSRKRKIIWYNPPYSKNVSTDVGQTFLKIIDEEFPADHPDYTKYSTVIQSRSATAVCQTLSRLSMDTTNPRCLHLSPRIVPTCAVALKTIKNCAHCLINVSPNRLYIKPQSLLRTKLQIDLPKHMWALLKTRSKQDLRTIKHHLTLLTNGTLLHLANMCGN